MDNLEDMDKFLENYNFPKQNQEEIEDLNRPRPECFTADCYQKFREELIPILLKLFQKIAVESKLPN